MPTPTVGNHTTARSQDPERLLPPTIRAEAVRLHTLASILPPAQQGEAAVAIAVLNKMVRTAKPVSVRIA